MQVGLGIGLVNPALGGAVAYTLGTLNNIAVNAEGWSANVTFGSYKTGGALNLTPDATPKFTFTVQSAGFTNAGAPTTVSRTVYGTIAKRQPYPNEANRVEAGGLNDTLTIAMSDIIHPTDTLTLTTISGALVDNGPGGSGNNSAAVTNAAVANHSQFTPQPPIAAWLTPQFQRATAAFGVELAVAHRFGQGGGMVQAVKFIATGQTSGHQNTVTTTAMSASARGSRVSLSIPIYAASIPLTGFTQNEVVLVDAIVYPFVGPSLQISVSGHAWPNANLTQLQFVNDPGGTYSGATAYVDIVNGTDATGAVNSSVNKFKTIGKALTAIQTYHNGNKGRNNIDGGTVLLENGTYLSFGPTDPSLLTWGGQCLCQIKPDTGSRATVTYNLADTTNIFIPAGGSGGGLAWSNITFSSLASNTFGWRGNNAASQYMWFDQCDFTGDNTTTAPLYQCGYQAFTDCHIFKMPCTLSPFGNTVQAAHLIAGCDIDTITDAAMIAYTFAGNKVHAGTKNVQAQDNTLNLMPIPDQAFFISNTFSISAFACGLFTNTGYSATNGIAFVQNLIEITAASEVQPALQISADADAQVLPNAVVAYNTVVGARVNFAYNDGTSSGGTAVSTFKDSVRRFNIFSNINNKTDTFLLNGGNAARIGNWSERFGVGCFGNTNQTGSFSGTTPGPDSWIGDYMGIGDVNVNNVGTSNPYLFTTAAYSTAYGGTGAGGGNYLPTANTSKAHGLVPSGAAMLPTDIVGTARRNTGTGYAGAYEGPV